MSADANQARLNHIQTIEDVRLVNTDDLVWLLERRYASVVVPPCRVCGRSLSVASFGGGRPTLWACSGLAEAGEHTSHAGSPYRVGRAPADEHYSASIFEDRSQGGDAYVLEVCRRLREVRAMWRDHGILGGAMG